MKENEPLTNEKVILAGICCEGATPDEADASLNELASLAETCGCQVVARLLQSRSGPDNAYFIGRGKADELKEMGKALEADTVIFDDELSGSQIKNLEDATGLKVIDRTMLILDIFASRAVSNEGKLQVELAQLRYRLPRLIGMHEALSRQGGGIGTRGPGESQLVTDRKHLMRRIHSLEERLRQSEKSRELLRKARSRSGICSVAIVGYTNAGKSTLMNALCDSNCLAEDKLFATLDTTTRRYRLPDGTDILMIDTVGFIRKLPHNIVEAFKSTLREAADADVLIHLCDASDPQLDEHIRVVDNLLYDLDVKDKDPILVFNKCDRLIDSAEPIISYEYRRRKPILISAVRRLGFEDLTDAITARVSRGTVKMWLFVPWNRPALEHEIRQYASVLDVRNMDMGRLMKIRVDESMSGRFSDYSIEMRS